jgi:hypothetical protein
MKAASEVDAAERGRVDGTKHCCGCYDAHDYYPPNILNVYTVSRVTAKRQADGVVAILSHIRNKNRRLSALLSLGETTWCSCTVQRQKFWKIMGLSGAAIR